MKAFFNTTLDYLALGIEPMTELSKHEDMVYKNQAEQKIVELEQKFKELKEIILWLARIVLVAKPDLH